MLDKDQIPPLKAIIKASYSPVLKRAMVNSFLLSVDQVRANVFREKPEDFMQWLYGFDGHKVCTVILKDINKNKDAFIVELMKQYGIDKAQDEFNIYIDELSFHFKKHLSHIEQLAFANKFAFLAQLTKVTEP